jgi:hypothetical protein
MVFRVFLSHSLDPSDQALAWRLQTLAAVHGIQVYVPRRSVYQVSQAESDAADRQDKAQMDRADCVLLIITADNRQALSAVRDELNRAVGQRRAKLIIPIIQEGFQQTHAIKDLLEIASVPLFVFSLKDDPGKAEGEIAQYLKRRRVSEEKQRAVQALVTTAMELVLLASLAEK